VNQDMKKQRAAEAALDFVRDGTIVGVGTGSTVNYFIEGLASLRHRIAGAVSSSVASTQRLEAHAQPRAHGRTGVSWTAPTRPRASGS
jgi:ribose 5-phosphate isomerase A